jgi:hypothetical protein
MNLLRHGGYRSIRQGFRELACDIKGMLALGRAQPEGAITGSLLGSPEDLPRPLAGVPENLPAHSPIEYSLRRL